MAKEVKAVCVLVLLGISLQIYVVLSLERVFSRNKILEGLFIQSKNPSLDKQFSCYKYVANIFPVDVTRASILDTQV